MLRSRRLTAALCALLLFQWTLVGSSVLCDTPATTAVAHGLAGAAKAPSVKRPHSTAPHGEQRHVRDPSVNTILLATDACAGIAGHGCDVPNAPSSSHCGATASCTASSAMTTWSTPGAGSRAHSPPAYPDAKAPPSWVLGPTAPPPRA